MEEAQMDSERWLKYRVKEEPKENPASKWMKYRIKEEEPVVLGDESKGFGGVATDALQKALEAAYGLPGALMALPEEAYGAGHQILTNPRRALQNIGAGFGELGHGILSAPGGIRDYLARKDLVPQHAPSFRLPESLLPREYNYGEALGAEGLEAGDTLLKGIPKGVAAAPFANKLFQLAGEIPLTKGVGGKKLNMVKRGIGGLDISKDILKDARQYLPKDTASKKLLKQAKTGDYKALFTLQSDLRKRGNSLKLSSSGADRLHGFDANKLRARLLNEMKEDLSRKGHKDLSELLHLGQKRYAQHMKYRPYVGLAAGLTLGQSPLKKLFHYFMD